ncbi:hypothetical protein [Frankia sp. ArI3]|uniref:hypothetical protein n=1 Tax=Frankia sp. ArI3 TaxID=1858 RepID=UPI002103EB43|nr:hypothetical protein [Frankia sp. ArI3]
MAVPALREQVDGHDSGEQPGGDQSHPAQRLAQSGFVRGAPGQSGWYRPPAARRLAHGPPSLSRATSTPTRAHRI